MEIATSDQAPRSLLEQLRLPHLPTSISVHATIFKDVTNAPFLRQQLLDGNRDFEYAFIDSRMILSAQHLAAAIWRAVNDMLHQRMRSKNVHSEIVFALSPNNNISAAFQTFGVNPDTCTLIAVKVAGADPDSLGQAAYNPDSIQQHLQSSVEGIQIPFNDESLHSFSDLTKISKVYKLGEVGAARGGKSHANRAGVNGSVPEDERSEMEAVVLGLMALRGM